MKRQYMKQYNKMSDVQKKNILDKEYTNNLSSFAEIAKQYQTYANKLRRDAIKFNIPIRNKSEAQKVALKQGRHSHPTMGKKRSEEEKQKIGLGVMESWDNISDQELDRRKQIAKNNWEKLSPNEQQEILKKANVAVRQSSSLGSKMELYILEKLIKDGYKVEFHKEQILVNTKLQIDLFLPTMDVAIEIDGPSHFEPVWGEDVLQKNKRYDTKKNGIILGRGITLIRIKQTKDFSKSRASIIYDKLKQLLSNKNSIPKYIEIGE
jgi:very-short-patch-repair endonuclease